MAPYLHCDYHQGTLYFSEVSRGRQCVPNCAIFLALLKLVPIHQLKKEHLNYILHCGDDMYKHVLVEKQITSNDGFLLIEELPKTFTLSSKAFTIKKGATSSGTLKKEMFYINNMLMSLEFALNLVFESSLPFANGIMIFCGSAIAIEKKEE